MTTEYAKFRKTRFFGSLDGLRAVSIAGVILFHSWWVHRITGDSMPFQCCGRDRSESTSFS